MKALVWAANVLAWPAIQLTIARTMLGQPMGHFMQESVLTRHRAWERDGSFYRRVFAVQRWKGLLPDGAAWLGSSPKRIHGFGAEERKLLLAETRRGERAHWYMLFCTPAFFLWNPPWACAVMAGYAVLANFPCIVAQRYNRIRLQRSLRGQVGR